MTLPWQKVEMYILKSLFFRFEPYVQAVVKVSL